MSDYLRYAIVDADGLYRCEQGTEVWWSPHCVGWALVFDTERAAIARCGFGRESVRPMVSGYVPAASNP